MADKTPYRSDDITEQDGSEIQSFTIVKVKTDTKMDRRESGISDLIEFVYKLIITTGKRITTYPDLINQSLETYENIEHF